MTEPTDDDAIDPNLVTLYGPRDAGCVSVEGVAYEVHDEGDHCEIDVAHAHADILVASHGWSRDPEREEAEAAPAAELAAKAEAEAKAKADDAERARDLAAAEKAQAAKVAGGVAPIKTERGDKNKPQQETQG